jgi:hypothetical protein
MSYHEEKLIQLAEGNAAVNKKLAAMRKNCDLNEKSSKIEAAINKIGRKETDLIELREHALALQESYDRTAVSEAQKSRSRNKPPVTEQKVNRHHTRYYDDL